MPRQARIVQAGMPHHVVQRGNNRQTCFFAEANYLTYLDWLQEYAADTGCAIHAYVLMTNHVHLLVTPEEKSSLAALMKQVSQRYTQYINHRYDRSGSLWEGRFRSKSTADDNYVLACYRYIELNPLRAHMVQHPSQYRWSSYQANAEGEHSGIITPHPTYQAMANTKTERLRQYRSLFDQPLDEHTLRKLRT